MKLVRRRGGIKLDSASFRAEVPGRGRVAHSTVQLIPGTIGIRRRFWWKGGRASSLGAEARRQPVDPPSLPVAFDADDAVEPTRPDGARGRSGTRVRCGKPCQDTPKGGSGPSLRGGRSALGSEAPRSEGWLCGCEGQAKGTPPTAVWMLLDRLLDVRWSSVVIADSVASSVVPVSTSSHTWSAWSAVLERWGRRQESAVPSKSTHRALSA